MLRESSGERAAGLLGATALFALAPPLHAATFTLDTEALTTVDNNLFRLSGAARDQLPHHGSDVVGAAYLALGISDSIGDVALKGLGSLQKSWFLHNDYLNNTGFSFNGKAQYAGADRSALLGVSSVRRLSSFEDLRQFARNLQTLTNADFLGTQQIAGAVRIVGTARLSQSQNSSNTLRLNDYRRAGFGGGLGYYSRAGNSISLEAHIDRATGLADRDILLNGRPLTYNASYTDRAVVVRTLYAPSVFWNVDGHVGYTWHKDRSGVAGDFSGITGDLSVTYAPLRVLTFRTRAARQFQSTSGIFSDGVRETQLSETIAAQPTRDLNISASFGRRWRRFRYNVQADTALLNQANRLDDANVTVQYTIGSVGVAVSGTSSRRTAGLPVYRFKDTTAGLTLTLGLGPHS